jgi:hypothetical protein
MSGNQIADWFEHMAKDGRKLGTTILKHGTVASAYLKLIAEPSGSLFKAMAAYDDGLPVQAVEVGGSDKPIHVLVEYVEDPFAETSPGTDPGGE